MKKNKFIDKCKSWFLTLGVASVFGLAALGVNAAKSYEKAYAYEYQDNGALVFDFSNDNNVDLSIIFNYFYVDDVTYNGQYFSFYYDHIGDLGDSFVDNIVCNDNTLGFNTSNSPVCSISRFIADGNYVYSYVDTSSYDESPQYFYSLPSYEGYQQLRNYALSYNAPQQSGNFITALTSFMSLLGGAIVQLATPVASGVTSFASALFIDNSHLSIMGGIIGIFVGIALAVGITSKVYAWVSTLGN